MNEAEYRTAITNSIKRICVRAEEARLRTNPRPPHALDWIWWLVVKRGERKDGKDWTPKWNVISRVSYPHMAEFLPRSREDEYAKTFVALEDFMKWFDRALIGECKHQEELNRQCESKIVRLQTHIALKGDSAT